MTALKYKNGNSWVQLPFAVGGTLDQMYPKGSFYTSPLSVYAGLANTTISNTADNEAFIFTYDLSTSASPAELYGGTWKEIVGEDGTNPSYNYTYKYIGMYDGDMSNRSMTSVSKVSYSNGSIGLMETFASAMYPKISKNGVNLNGWSDYYWEKKTSKVPSSDTELQLKVYYCYKMWQRIA